MGKYFGTDGFRGEANEVLTVEHAFKVGRFLGWYYGQDHKARVVIGKDTRRSSYMFEYALAAGLTASGADAFLLHVTTTPSVSYVTRTEDFDCGIMISASHNPFYDNGIKIINGKGHKMEAEVEEKIEAYIDGEIGELPLARRDAIGRTTDYVAGRNRYVGYLISLATRSFEGKKIALDCSNGSAFMIAKSVYDALGAKTYVINNEPNGLNINLNCGSTHIDVLKQYVKDNGLDVGFAFDGDADRCIAIMSNLGLYKACDKAGLKYEKTAVGDKYVYENMVKNNFSLGGEQSGHIIFSKHATTGDGILTSLMVMEVMLEKKLPLSKLAEEVRIYPQLLKNVRVTDKKTARENPAVVRAVDEVAKALGDDGRILVRESGTEPVIRVMVEAETDELCEKYVNQVVDVMHAENLAVEA